MKIVTLLKIYRLNLIYYYYCAVLNLGIFLSHKWDQIEILISNRKS